MVKDTIGTMNQFAPPGKAEFASYDDTLRWRRVNCIGSEPLPAGVAVRVPGASVTSGRCGCEVARPPRTPLQMGR